MKNELKQKQIEEMVTNLLAAYNGARQFEGTLMLDTIFDMAKYLANKYQPKIPENAVVLTDDELNEVIDTCKVSMIVTDDDGEKYISLDDHNEYTERLGKIVRQRKARIEYLEKLLDDRCDRCIERERKETAEKFAERLKAHLKQSYHNLYHADYREGMVSINLGTLIENIDEICKEITEGKV